ncbi:cupin [Halobacteriales archaeon QS_1_68_17]|nr:MAG: cupin [Halobacteriales archaeon QS_1_68_17]
MSYTKSNIADVEPVGGGLHFLREPLGCEKLGVSVLECDPGWTGKEHDHEEDGQEEVYVLVEGEARMHVDGEAVELDSGDALRVPAGATRQIHNGDAKSTFVIAGAP